MPITLEDLKAVVYLKPEHLGDGRIVNLMPLWDGENWRVWLDTGAGLAEGKMTGVVEGDYVARSAATQSDLFIPFVHTMWQRASWPEIYPLIRAISDDFHNMGTSAAKLRHFFDSRKSLPPGGASRFASTELEYLVTLCRAVFDLMQEMLSEIWLVRVRLTEERAEERRRSSRLPDTFSKVVLREKRELRNALEIEEKFGVPRVLAEQYAKIGAFFSGLRDIRDNVVHGGSGVGQIFDTEKGFCVDPKRRPYSSFAGWQEKHRYNENLVSVLPWIADVVLQTIEGCNRLVAAFASVIQLPPEIAPGYTVFVRGPHNGALVSLLEVQSGSSSWWTPK